MNFWLTMRPGGPKTDFCRILRQKSMPQRPPLWYNNINNAKQTGGRRSAAYAKRKVESVC